MIVRRRWLVALALQAAGCQDQPGELDPDVVNAIAVKAGNAVGFQRTGDYLADLEVVECSGCAALLQLGGTGCTLGEGTSFRDQVSLLQTDGVLLLEYRDVHAVGPLDVDGAFSVGSVADLSNALAELHVVLRVDGEFEEDPSDRFTGLVRQRTHGETSSGELVDCFETYDVAADRL